MRKTILQSVNVVNGIDITIGENFVGGAGIIAIDPTVDRSSTMDVILVNGGPMITLSVWVFDQLFPQVIQVVNTPSFAADMWAVGF